MWPCVCQRLVAEITLASWAEMEHHLNTATGERMQMGLGHACSHPTTMSN